MKEHPVSYNITENIGYENISTINYTDFSVLDDGLPAGAAANNESYEQYVTNTTMYRFRLAYDDVDAKAADGTTDAIPHLVKNGAEIPASNFTSYSDAEAAYKARKRELPIYLPPVSWYSVKTITKQISRRATVSRSPMISPTGQKATSILYITSRV